MVSMNGQVAVVMGISSLWSQGGKWKYRIGFGGSRDRIGLPIASGGGHIYNRQIIR